MSDFGTPTYHAAPPPEKDHRSSWLGVLLASPVVAGLIALLVAWSPWDSGKGSGPTTHPSATLPAQSSRPPQGFNASVYVNPTSGAGGTSVTLSGEDFPANTRVEFTFHTEVIGETRTNSAGKFSNVVVTIPTDFSAFAPQQFMIAATAGAFSAQTPFQLTG